jgi:hypothetical protein
MNEIERKHANARISRIVCYCGLAFPCGQTVLGEVVNLKRFKTRVAREQSTQHAEVNRTRFGRTNSERVSDERRENRASDLLDQHRIDGGDAS